MQGAGRAGSSGVDRGGLGRPPLETMATVTESGPACRLQSRSAGDAE